LLRVVARRQSEGDRIVEAYEYDASGRKKKTFYVDLAAQRPNTHYAWGVEGTDSAYSAPGAASLVTLYDERDQPTDVLFHDTAGRELSRLEFRYDDAGRLIEEVQMNNEDALPPEILASLNEAQLETARALFGVGGAGFRRAHRYDAQGRRAETRSRFGLGGDHKTRVYNDHGDQILEIFENNEQEYGIDDEGRRSDAPTNERVTRSEARFLYDYDTHHNWVTKTVESRGGIDQEFAVCSVERRTITYLE
jgi:YD repeat-containing protein